MGFLSNGKGRQWISCCWCVAQPPSVVQTDDKERDGLMALAQAKKAGWRITNVARKWLGLCPECQQRGAEFPGPNFVLGFSGNPNT